MSDITLVCPGCGNQVTVSEYVAASSLGCAQCKARIPVPQREPQTPWSAGIRLTSACPTPSQGPITPQASTPVPSTTQNGSSRRSGTGSHSPLKTLLTHPRQRRSSRRTNLLWHRVWPWILFTALTTLLAWLRFWPDPMLSHYRENVILTGVWGLLALHVAVILHAFNDDGFDGVLCTIIPGYTLYYLFFKTSQYYMQVLVAASLLVFGKDASLTAHRLWDRAYRDITSWIQGNDTFKKDMPR